MNCSLQRRRRRRHASSPVRPGRWQRSARPARRPRGRDTAGASFAGIDRRCDRCWSVTGSRPRRRSARSPSAGSQRPHIPGRCRHLSSGLRTTTSVRHIPGTRLRHPRGPDPAVLAPAQSGPPHRQRTPRRPGGRSCLRPPRRPAPFAGAPPHRVRRPPSATSCAPLTRAHARAPTGTRPTMRSASSRGSPVAPSRSRPTVRRCGARARPARNPRPARSRRLPPALRPTIPDIRASSTRRAPRTRRVPTGDHPVSRPHRRRPSGTPSPRTR